MRSEAEREAVAMWLQQQHKQFLEVEKLLDVDFCQECNRIVPEGTEHDAEAHLAIQ